MAKTSSQVELRLRVKQLGSRVTPEMLRHLRLTAIGRGCTVTDLVNEALADKFGSPETVPADPAPMRHVAAANKKKREYATK